MLDPDEVIPELDETNNTGCTGNFCATPPLVGTCLPDTTPPAFAGIEMVEITLGSSSDSFSQVLEGDLEAGDLIILNPPSNIFNGPGGGGGPFGSMFGRP